MRNIQSLRVLVLSGCTLLLLVIPVAGGAGGGMHGHGMGMMHGGSARHHFYMRNGLPSDYAGKRNPLPATAENIQAGKQLFEKKCARCHGVSGHGDGPDAKGLVPAPANLAAIRRMRMASDAYFYWTISEGGAQFNTEMPSWKGTLEESEIWKLILYLHEL